MPLATRYLQPERMDQPGLDPFEHHRALRGLQRINWVSRTASALVAAIRRTMLHRSDRPLRVLDIACGGGDVTRAMARRAYALGLEWRVDGCDKSQTAIDYALDRIDQLRSGGGGFFVQDALADSLPDDYDVLVSSLFLHHLERGDAVALLTNMRRAARQAVLIDDLRRGPVGYLFAQVGCRLLSRSPVVHFDGPASVRAAWSIDEVRAIASAAGLAPVEIDRRWPARFLLRWRRIA